MSIILHRDPRTVVPDLIDWFEEPFLTLRPYLGQAIKVEDYTEDGHYVVRAEVAGVDPDKELEVWTGAGYLTIRAVRSDRVEDKHRSEFRYGSFNRTVQLPSAVDAEDVTAEYATQGLAVYLGAIFRTYVHSQALTCYASSRSDGCRPCPAAGPRRRP